MSWILFPLLVLLAIPALALLTSARHEPVEDKIRRNRRIADFTFFHAHSTPDRLRLRAGPNARLVTTFGIRNSFTTEDEAEHARFLRRAVETINRADRAAWLAVWTEGGTTLDAVIAAAAAAAAACPRVGGVGVARAARVLGLDAVLGLLFPDARARPVDVGAADGATAAINELWLGSKRAAPADGAGPARCLPPHPLLRLRLRTALHKLVPGHEADETLALVMPAYETLWRVVLLTYVHVAFRRVDDETRELVRGVVETVCESGAMGMGMGVRLPRDVDYFSREALRLYPPTKRIYRASPSGQVAADVESMHHDERVWGPDALQFRPRRFAALTRNQRDAYMPFGVGKQACPAANGFGRTMIALLVVVMIRQLGTRESGARVWFGDEALDGDVAAPLPTGRGDVGGWVVSPGGMD